MHQHLRICTSPLLCRENDPVFTGSAAFPLPGSSSILPDAFIDALKKKRYSKNSEKNYSHHLQLFLQFIGKPPLSVIDNDISAYIRNCADNDSRSPSFQNAATYSIKFYYEKVLGRSIEKNAVLLPKSEHKLPLVFSRQEVACDANVPTKHKKPPRWAGYMKNIIDNRFFYSYRLCLER